MWCKAETSEEEQGVAFFILDLLLRNSIGTEEMYENLSSIAGALAEI
jgi:hypothetical protein